MSKLPVLNSKEAIKLLQQFGYTIDRIAGIHYILKKDKNRIVIPYHNKDFHPKITKEVLEAIKE